MQDLPILVLNLKHREDRATHMRAQLRASRGQIEFLEGVNGHEMPEADWREWAARIATSRYAGMDPRRQRGSVGCLLSHRKAWERLAALDAPLGLILEDDVVLSADFASLLARTPWHEFSADIFKLDTFLTRTRVGQSVRALPGSRHLHPLLGNHLGGAAYLLPQKSIGPLLELTRDRFEAIDDFLFDRSTALRPPFEVLQLYPAAVIQLQHARARDLRGTMLPSDIGTVATFTRKKRLQRGFQSAMSFRWPLWHRLARSFRREWTTRVPFR